MIFFFILWELQACGYNTGNDGDVFGDDGMKREPQSQQKTLVDVEAWGPPITHFINIKPNPEQITESLLNISVSLQRKQSVIYAQYIKLI